MGTEHPQAWVTAGLQDPRGPSPQIHDFPCNRGLPAGVHSEVF